MSIEYFPEDKCFFCHFVGATERHHLWRASLRKTSPTIQLCRRCHQKATVDKEFEIHLQKLWKQKQFTQT